MLAYGCVIGSEGRYRELALPGILRASGGREPLTEIGAECIFRALNRIIDRALELPELEGLVLIHDDLEIHGESVEDALRPALNEPGVGIVGAIGGVGVADMGWWACRRALGGVRWRAPSGSGPFGSIPGGWDLALGPGRAGDVDAVDGLLLALSAEALAALRFDERLGPGFHGYDADICFQARERGLRVRAVPLVCTHHNDGVPSPRDRAGWKRANVAFRRKWEARWPSPAGASAS